MATKILVGADPEIFVRQNGVFKSAHGLIKGDKKNPSPVPNGAVQVDGMALEFNIDPAASQTEFVFRIQDVMDQLKAMVPEYELVATPVADFDADYIKSQPAEALELGCDPDFNAWTGYANPRPDGNRPMRTASGHVHIGWTSDKDSSDIGHQEVCRRVARQMDFFLGLPSLIYDTDTRRREMYGKAGALRYKSYGVEYRTLSNVWLNSKEKIAWVYSNVMQGMERLMAGEDLSERYGDIQEIINTSNVVEAKKILKAENIEVIYG